MWLSIACCTWFSGRLDTQDGSWFCQTRLCPRTRMPCALANDTTPSPGPKLYDPLDGSVVSHFISLPGVTMSNCWPCASAAARSVPPAALAGPAAASAPATTPADSAATIADLRVIATSSSARGEVLVGAGGVLARPLVELLAQVAAGAEHVQAQAAALVLELPGTVGLLCGQPQAAGRSARGRLDDVRNPGGCRAAGHGHVVAGVLGLEFAVTAGDRHELELLVGLAVAGPLVDRRAARGGVPEHVQAQCVAGQYELVIAAGEPAAARPGRCQVDREGVVGGLEGDRHR